MVAPAIPVVFFIVSAFYNTLLFHQDPDIHRAQAHHIVQIKSTFRHLWLDRQPNVITSTCVNLGYSTDSPSSKGQFDFVSPPANASVTLELEAHVDSLQLFLSVTARTDSRRDHSFPVMTIYESNKSTCMQIHFPLLDSQADASTLY